MLRCPVFFSFRLQTDAWPGPVGRSLQGLSMENLISLESTWKVFPVIQGRTKRSPDRWLHWETHRTVQSIQEAGQCSNRDYRDCRCIQKTDRQTERKTNRKKREEKKKLSFKKNYYKNKHNKQVFLEKNTTKNWINNKRMGRLWWHNLLESRTKGRKKKSKIENGSFSPEFRDMGDKGKMEMRGTVIEAGTLLLLNL